VIRSSGRCASIYEHVSRRCRGRLDASVLHYLRSRGLPTDQSVVDAVMAAAKRSERLLTEDEIPEAVRSAQAR
jgi:hypothetical protein